MLLNLYTFIIVNGTIISKNFNWEVVFFEKQNLIILTVKSDKRELLGNFFKYLIKNHYISNSKIYHQDNFTIYLQSNNILENYNKINNNLDTIELFFKV